MDWPLIATWATIIASGVLMYFTGYVLVEHARAVKRGARSIIPMHVLAVAASYSGLVVTLLTDQRDFHGRFWIYFPSLLLGVYGLRILSRAQRRRTLIGYDGEPKR